MRAVIDTGVFVSALIRSAGTTGAILRALRDRIGENHPHLVELSMGMTDDFEVAIEEGATVLRVGRAIFGPFDDGD